MWRILHIVFLVTALTMVRLFGLARAWPWWWKLFLGLVVYLATAVSLELKSLVAGEMEEDGCDRELVGYG